MTERGMDRVLMTVVAILAGAGLVFLYSSSAWISERAMQSPHQMFVSQAIKAAMGFALLLLVSRLDYRLLEGRWSWLAWGGTTLLLLFLAIDHPWKETVRQTDRWIRLGSISIQPSEFARVTLLMTLASVVTRRAEVDEPRWRRLAEMGVVIVVPIALVLSQPNFGTAMTMGLSALILLVAAGLPWRWLAAGGGALVCGVGLLTLKYPYPAERVKAWVGTWGDFGELSFQIKQGIVALGSGGVTGVGLGQSIQKRMFVPDPHTDLILAIIGEEVGFLGLLVLVVLFGVLLWRGFQIANRAPDTLGYLLAAGITIQIGLYALINAGVVVGLLPVTGLPLPFVSYGGSALMANLASIGILLSISRRASWQGELRQTQVLGTGWRA